MECERFTASVTTNVRAGIAQAFEFLNDSLYYGFGPTQAARRSEASIHCCFMAKPGRMRKLSSGVSPLARGSAGGRRSRGRLHVRAPGAIRPAFNMAQSDWYSPPPFRFKAIVNLIR